MPGSDVLLIDLVVELSERRWTEVLEERTRGSVGTDQVKMFNAARALVRMLRLVHSELSDPRYRPMAAYVGAALAGWQIRIRPLAPSEIHLPDASIQSWPTEIPPRSRP